MFGGRRPATYDRQQSLREAEAFRARGKTRKAARALLEILTHDPADAEVHRKLAPMLASLGDHAGAATSFRIAADGLMASGMADKAISVYLQVVEHRPNDTELWEQVARLHLERSRRAEAVKVLCEGADRQRGRHRRSRAARLLQCALAVEPDNLPLAIRTARMLVKDGRKAEARAVLDDQLRRASGPTAKAVRGAQLRLWPSPATLWRYLRA